VVAAWIGSLALACAAERGSGGRAGEIAAARSEGLGVDQEDGEPKALVRIFAGRPFYLERPEPEESFRGILRRAEVREGPDTRDLPFRLEVGDERLSVYTSGLDDKILQTLVDREVEAIGKRIDLRHEGFGVEIWIATISPAEAHTEPDG
jgi:hypothetical protein